LPIVPFVSFSHEASLLISTPRLLRSIRSFTGPTWTFLPPPLSARSSLFSSCTNRPIDLTVRALPPRQSPPDSSPWRKRRRGAAALSLPSSQKRCPWL
jgi:hypothetical protein